MLRESNTSIKFIAAGSCDILSITIFDTDGLFQEPFNLNLPVPGSFTSVFSS